MANQPAAKHDVNPKYRTRGTYRERMMNELTNRNRWLYPREWDEISVRFPTMTEEEAEKEYLAIRKKIMDRVEYDRRVYE